MADRMSRQEWDAYAALDDDGDAGTHEGLTCRTLAEELRHPAPVVVCSHGTAALLGVEHERTIVADTPEARDPAWWASQVPPRAAYRVLHYPRGIQGPAVDLGGRDVEGRTTYAPPPVPRTVAPAEIVVQLDAASVARLAPLLTLAAQAGRPVNLRGVLLVERAGRLPIYEGR